MINDEHCKHKLHHHIVRAYCHEGKLLGKLMAKPFKTPSNELAEIAVNHFTIQHAREQVSHSTKPVGTICQDQRQTAHTSYSSHGHTPSVPSKDCPNCTQQHPAGRANCPAHDSHCSKCDKMGHWGPKCHGGKPLQSRNAPPPGSQQRKSRCPPRNHNHCQGQKNKTDAIDVREDHSPQDKVALHHIQHSTTTRNTHPKRSWSEMYEPHNAMRPTPPSSCLQVPAEREQPHSVLRWTPELEATCYPSVCFDAYTQIRSAQLAYPLALITSTPDPLHTMDPIYPYMVHSKYPSLGSQITLVLASTG